MKNRFRVLNKLVSVNTNLLNAVLVSFLVLGSYNLVTCQTPSTQKQNQLEIVDYTHEALPIVIVVSPEHDKELLSIAHILAKNLERSGQFKMTVRAGNEPSSQAEFAKLLDKSFPLGIFLTHTDPKRIGWRLYDIHDEYLVKGMNYVKRGKDLHNYADNLADELWPVLTKQSSSFSSKIAYVKRKKSHTKRPISVVCIAHSDGSYEQELIKNPGTYVSLYWHHDKRYPCLFCSEFTRFNVRLISANMQGKRNIVLNLNGTCVGISVAHDNNKAVYCRSGVIWQYSYDQALQRSVHKAIIKNNGKNVSPILLQNGDIIFGSDCWGLRKGKPKATGPQLYIRNAADGAITALTDDGYCVGPSYCVHKKKLAYSKKVNGGLQLFVYDFNTKQHKQITFDKGDKIDCCWSPCGNYLVYCYKNGKEARIALLHLGMKKVTFITPQHEYCTCPAWSPVYDIVPNVGR